MPFRSTQPDIDPPSLPLWTWLFNSPSSPLNNNSSSTIAGFTDASTTARISYSTLKTHTTHLSTALTKQFNLQRGDTVALFSHNTIWYPCAMFAVLRVGGVVSGASPAYGVEEMAYALRKAKARFVFTVKERLEVAVEAARMVGLDRGNVFILEGEVDGFRNMEDLLELGKKEEEQVGELLLRDGESNGKLCGFLSFSSGTTGLPKAVMISHRNVIAQCLQIQQITPSTHKKILAVLPSFHITGLVHVLHLPLLLNAEVYFLPSFTMQSMLDTVTKYQIGELLLVPPILIRMVRDPIVKEYDLSCVQRFSSGAAPLSEEIIQLLEKTFPGTGFKQGYGMTESCSCITAHPPEKYAYEHAHKVGTICASTEVKIMSDDGRELGIGEPGELWARGPQITMGYLENEEATKSSFDIDGEGWLRTGDQAVVDKDGMVTITDRIKEMIKVKGIGVAPAELEDLLLGHKEVEDCAVLGISDDYSGERPKAFVVLNNGRKGDDKSGKDLLAYVKEKKVRHKWLAEVEFVDIIPKSASGKILRRVLKNQAKKGEKGLVVKDEKETRAKL